MISRRSIACLMPVLCLCLLKHPCFAQDRAKHSLAKVSPTDFVLPSTPIIDSNTHAVILADEGEVHYIGNRQDWFSYVYTRQTKIKILDKTAFGLATVEVDLINVDDHADVLGSVIASTYNIENGQLVETKLDPKDIFFTKVNKYYRTAKFSLPGVKEGSILEYTYTVTSEYSDYLPSWTFQREKIPCLSSEFKVEIPETMSFVLVRQGFHSYAVDKGSTGYVSYNVTGKLDDGRGGKSDDPLFVSAGTVKHDWVMKDIPAFGTEQFLTTPENYLDKLSFQLAAIRVNNHESFAHNTTWAKTTEELLSAHRFGVPLTEEESPVSQLADKIPVGNDALEQAKAVYYYVSKHFACTDHSYMYIETNLKDVIRNNSGSVGEINLLLVALLRKRGMQADPVVLSTREHGYNLASYPVLDKLNYVVVRLYLGGKLYYLDAAHPQLGFGQLAGDCYNGHARVISNRDSSSVYFWADSLKESKVTMVLLSGTEKGLEGTLQSTLGPEESYQLRRQIAEHSEQQYFKDIQTSFGEDADISNGGIDSLSRLEDPIKVHYDFLLKQTAGASIIYFNPVMSDGLRENPFKAADRKYPVEMPYAMDQTYVLSMDIPEGYVVDELPKSAKVALNGDQGYFEYLLQAQGGKIQMRCRVRLSKALFPPEDYGSLRDFYAFIVKKENEQIVLKKK
jgi:Domain of Unknown Function with PDB structure (DUF3857)/Transglutaminase-like superfamily